MSESHAHDWDDDFRIGVPGRGGPAVPVAPIPDDAPDPSLELRAGETELGRPPQIPAGLAPLSDADRERLRKAEIEQAEKDLAEAESILAAEPGVLRWAGWFASPVAVAFLLGSAGLCGLFVFNQILAVLANLALLQEPLFRYGGYALLAVFGGAVLVAFLRLVILYARLRRNRQVQLRGLNEIARRTRLRWLARAKSIEARQQLGLYLTTYPTRTERDRRRMAGIGLTDERQGRMAAARAELLDPAKFTSSDEWFARFRDAFQGEIDAAAEERIKYWSKRTAVVTALAPNALVDGAATLYFGFAMLTDLCRLYNLRAGRTATAVLLGRVFFNAYLAGQLSEWESLTEAQLETLFGPNGPLYELFAAKVVAKVGAKAASGVLNYFLISRLGRLAAKLLQPVSVE